MKKKISILLSAVMLLGIIIPAFADGKSAGEKLRELEIIEGDLSGDLMVEKNLKRQDALVILIRMLGVEDEAKAFKGSAFSDVKEGSFYYPYIAYAKKNLLTNGMGNDMFGFDSYVSEKQTAKFMLNSLGYQDTKWEDVEAKAKSVGIYEGLSFVDDKEILRERVFQLMLNTLNSIPRNKDRFLLDILKEEKNKKDKKTETPNSDEFTVLDVKTDNLKTMELKFSQKIDKDYLTDNSITVKNLSSSLYLMEDLQTVKVIFNSQRKQGETIEVILNDIYNEDRTKRIENKIIKATVNDNDNPKILDANWLDNKTILVSSSEPIRIIENSYREFEEIKINDKKTRVKVIQNFEKNKLYLILSSDQNSGNYSFEIDGLKDYSSKAADKFVKTIVLDSSVPSPEIVKAEVLNSDTIKVEYSVPIYQKGSYRVGSNYDRQITNYNNIPNEFIVNFRNSFGTNIVRGAELEYKGQKNSKGDILTDWHSFAIKVKDDTSFPTVSVKPIELGFLELTFSKPMRANSGKITLWNKDGKEIKSAGNSYVATNSSPFIFKSGSNNRVLLLQFNALKNVDGEKFTVKVQDMRDKSIRSNPLVKGDVEFMSFDQKAPELVFKSGNQGVKLIKDSSESKKDMLRFIFSEPMNEEDLNNLSNYVIEDSDFGPVSHISGASVYEISDNGKAVSLVVPNARSISKTKPIKVLAMRDLAGNIMKTTEARIFSSDSFYLQSVKAVSSDSLELKFSEAVGLFDNDAFMIRRTAEQIIYINSYEIKDNVVTVYTNTDIPSDISGYTLISTDAYSGIKSIFMDELRKVSYMTIQDGIRPYVKEVEAKDDHSFDIIMSEWVSVTAPQNIKDYIQIFDKDNRLIDSSKIQITNNAEQTVFNVKGMPGNEFVQGDNYTIKVLAAWDSLENQSNVYENLFIAR